MIVNLANVCMNIENLMKNNFFWQNMEFHFKKQNKIREFFV